MPKLSKSLTASVAGQAAAGGLATDFVYRMDYSSASNSYAYACAPDSEGNIIVAYYDASLNNYVCVAKVDREGNTAWQTSLNVVSTATNTVRSLAFDSNDDVYITTDWGNLYIHKLAGSDGSFQWSKLFGNSSSDDTHSVIIDSNDNLFLQTYNAFYGSGGTNSSITKMATDGSQLWTRHFNLGTPNIFAYGICLDSSGNVFMPFYGSHATEKAGVIKISGSDASILQVKYFAMDTNYFTASNAVIYPFGIAADSNDNIWISYDYQTAGLYGGGMGLMQLDNDCDFIKAYEYQDDAYSGTQGSTIDLFSYNGLRILSTGELVFHSEFSPFQGSRNSTTCFVINPSNGDIARTRSAMHETYVTYNPYQFYIDAEDNVYTACTCQWQTGTTSSTSMYYKGDFTVMSLKSNVPNCVHIPESMVTLLSSPSDPTTLINKYTATHTVNNSTAYGSNYEGSTGYNYTNVSLTTGTSTMPLTIYNTKSTEYNGSIEIVGFYQNGTSGSTASTSVALPLMQPNDVVIGFRVTNYNNSWSADYTNIVSIVGNASGSYDAYLSVFYKVMGATPDTSIVFPGAVSTSSSMAFGYIILRGVDTTTPIDVTPTTLVQDGWNYITPPSITPVTDGALVISVVGQGSNYPQNQYISINNASSEDCFFCISGYGSDTLDTAIGWTLKEWKTGDGEMSFTERKHGFQESSLYAAAAASIAIRPA